MTEKLLRNKGRVHQTVCLLEVVMRREKKVGAAGGPLICRSVQETFTISSLAIDGDRRR